MIFDMETRCLQIWQVLIGCATNRQTIWYSTVTEKLEWSVPDQGYGHHLRRISKYCKANSLPDLTALIVLKGIGCPPSDKHNRDSWDIDREKVYAKNWYAEPPPTRQSLLTYK